MNKFTKRLFIGGLILTFVPLIVLLLAGVTNGFLDEFGLIPHAANPQALPSEEDNLVTLACVLCVVLAFMGISLLIWGGLRALIFKLIAKPN